MACLRDRENFFDTLVTFIAGIWSSSFLFFEQVATLAATLRQMLDLQINPYFTPYYFFIP
jgi:arginine exporter protein ArgO